MQILRVTTLLLAILPGAAFATTYYVNGLIGSDSNSGRSSGSPKKTIQAAIDAASGGDMINVEAGTYSPITILAMIALFERKKK